MAATIATVLKQGIGIAVIIALIILGLASKSILEFVDNTEYAVHQSAVKGKITVWNTPGMKFQWFGKVSKFPKSSNIYLSADELDGGKGRSVQPVQVLFPDGNAAVDVVARYELSLIEDIQKDIYRKYGNYNAIHNLVRQQIIEAVKGVGPLMSSSEAYSDRKPEVAVLARNMSLDGIYASSIQRDTTYDVDSNVVVVKKYKVSRDSLGQPIITKRSILNTYNIVLPVFNVKDMAFDDKTIDLIEARKDAQLAKQDAITAFQTGQARIAKERATQEVLKIKEVTIAEKNADVARIKAEQEKSVAVTNATRESEVAELGAQKAKQVALKTIREAKAEADANALKVKAGLTPQERAEWRYKSHVDGMKAMYGPGIGAWDLPDIMAGGGSEGGAGFMDALGWNQMMEIQEKMDKKSKK